MLRLKLLSELLLQKINNISHCFQCGIININKQFKLND